MQVAEVVEGRSADKSGRRDGRPARSDNGSGSGGGAAFEAQPAKNLACSLLCGDWCGAAALACGARPNELLQVL
jgi:hypothetical protein